MRLLGVLLLAGLQGVEARLALSQGIRVNGRAVPVGGTACVIAGELKDARAIPIEYTEKNEGAAPASTYSNRVLLDGPGAAAAESRLDCLVDTCDPLPPGRSRVRTQVLQLPNGAIDGTLPVPLTINLACVARAQA